MFIPNLCPKNEKEFKIRENAVRMAVKDFAENAEQLIMDNITATGLIEDGGINPYMAKALNFENIEETLDFFISRRAERSLGTSFGSTLERYILELTGGKSCKQLYPICRKKIPQKDKPWCCWWDVIVDTELFEEDGKKYKGLALAVKSGPSSMNSDMVKKFVDHAKEAQSKDYRPYLIFTYGKSAFSTIGSTLESKGFKPEKYVRIGQAIFEEFFNEPQYYKKSLKLFEEGGFDKKISDLIEKKKNEVIKELKEKYSNDLGELLEATLKKELISSTVDETIDDTEKVQQNKLQVT